MGLISQTVRNLLNGVSQAAHYLRDPSQVSEQINMLSHPAYGVMKRPPSVRSATLSDSAGSGSAFLHTVNRDAANRYRVVIMGGALSVHDAVTGSAVTVDTPNGTDYLTSSDPENDFRAVTIGDKTYIVNRSTIVKKSSVKSSAAKNEALIAVRQADFATFYGVTLNSTTIHIDTPDGSSPHDRGLISTDYIATEIANQIKATAALSDFKVKQYGSTLHIERTDGADFSISASDGLADQGILAIKGSVQRFDYLPERAKKGFVVEITGDPGNKFDNYFVVYDDNGAPNLAGVWRETVAPDILTGLDPTTMPHLLALDGALLDGVVAQGLPAAPTVSAAAEDTPSYAGWTKGNEALNPAWSYVLNDQAQWAAATLSTLNGGPATVAAYYDADTTALQAGSNVTIQLWSSNSAHTGTPPDFDSGSCTLETSKTYQAGVMQYDESLSAVGNWPANTVFYTRFLYASGSTPAANKAGAMRLHVLGQNGRQPLEISTLTGTQLNFDPDTVYPQGTAVSATAAGTTKTYTTTSDQNGTAVATALCALFTTGSAVATNPDDGVILFTLTTSVPEVTVSMSFPDTTTLYNSELSLTADALIGKVIENLSDGCKGTITDNTTTEIVVSSLTGGTNNKFSKGDLCRVVGAGVNFTFDVALWKSREAGDLLSNPDPSFVNQQIQDIFFEKNRLCVVAGQNFVASQAADSLNFYRRTVTQVLPDDIIDVQSANQMLTRFHSAVHWGGKLLLWSDEGQSEVIGQPALSPQTIGINPLSQFPNAAKCKPAVLGRRILFARTRGESTQVFEYSVVNQTGTADADETTRQVPTYLLGNPLQIVGDAALGFAAVRTDNADNVLYVQNFSYGNQNKEQEAWGKWVFASGAHILAMDMLDGVLALVVRRSDGVYLEEINLVVQPADGAGEYKDGRQGSAGSYTGDTYESRIDLSHVFMRRFERFGNTDATTAGRLIVRYMTFKYHDSRDFAVTVTPDSGTASSYPLTSATPATGVLRVPVMAVNTTVQVSVGNTSADGFRISGFDWEATYHNRSQFV